MYINSVYENTDIFCVLLCVVYFILCHYIHLPYLICHSFSFMLPYRRINRGEGRILEICLIRLQLGKKVKILKFFPADKTDSPLIIAFTSRFIELSLRDRRVTSTYSSNYQQKSSRITFGCTN